MADFHDALDCSLASHFRLYVQHRLRYRSRKTLDRYQVALRHFDRFLGRPALLADLTDENLADAMHALADSRQWAAGSANKFRSCLLAFWRFLARKRIVEKFPDVEKFREPKRVPLAWKRDELSRLWAACDAQRGNIAGIPASKWWHALHALAWDSAERIGAVLGLTWECVSLSSRIAVFKAEIRKGGREDKACLLHPETVALLEAIRTRDRRVLPWPYSECYLWMRYTAILDSAGLPSGRDSKFHRLRKSSASWFAAAGGNATELLGHGDPKLTRETYLDPRITGFGEIHAADLLFRPGDDLRPAG